MKYPNIFYVLALVFCILGSVVDRLPHLPNKTPRNDLIVILLALCAIACIVLGLLASPHAIW